MYEDFNNSNIYDNNNNNEENSSRMIPGEFIPEEPKRPKKKKGGVKKVALLTAAALLFGTVSGSTMVGINMVANYFEQQQNPARTELTTVPAGNSDSSSGSEGAADGTQVSATLDVSSIVEKAMPSVVAINNRMLVQSNNWFFGTQQYEADSAGSGIIVGQNDTELLIVTNNHVVENSEDLSVVFIDNQSVTAHIKGTDATNDLAVIAVNLSDIPADTMSKISIAVMGDSDSLKVGQGVIAIGNALGYGQSVTVGYISALNREVHTSDDNITRNLLQTDAAINPGNSGGALLNMNGEVIGINSAKYSDTSVEGMGYAIPISAVKDIINELMNTRTRTEVDASRQGYLGIQALTIDQTYANTFGMPQGVYVYKITEGGAASKSDLREKDIITKFDGSTVRSMEDLQQMLTYYEGGETVTLTVQTLENGQYVEREVEITLDFRPADDAVNSGNTQN
ncbi:MAG TPA: trypsin-like peptidase domain-containing protein [Candidatus Lachnoclostridium stercorigallinarum]|uniref:Trypsin-like peptidase domain-containing protein n=1 Tax=Candidatus Lachnoclostridium stercorigallinarum TaxID=2838634 RepID=A0A9D2GJU0_9FIRM|nr:trypsin-like peptidase domain-containing protein [Candidatus Lachnoclostridium stercorigallinarum]